MKPIHIIAGLGVLLILGVGAWYMYMQSNMPFEQAPSRGIHLPKKAGGGAAKKAAEQKPAEGDTLAAPEGDTKAAPDGSAEAAPAADTGAAAAEGDTAAPPEGEGEGEDPPEAPPKADEINTP